MTQIKQSPPLLSKAPRPGRQVIASGLLLVLLLVSASLACQTATQLAAPPTLSAPTMPPPPGYTPDAAEPLPSTLEAPRPACTPPPCGPDEMYYCPDECPGGCGTICATPTPLGEETPEDRPVSFFLDDFANLESGWPRERDVDFITDYDQGGYRIWVNQAGQTHQASPGANFGDVLIKVEATVLADAQSHIFGVLCRYDRTTGASYDFFISSDGYYMIYKRHNGDGGIVGDDSYGFSDAIEPNAVTYRIQASCIGDRLTLSVNDTLLVETVDPDLTAGDVGLVVGAVGEPNADILFDNFVAQEQ